MAEEKIAVYNMADLKNTTDDAIPNYLNSLGFVQSHRLIDVRLALGYSSFAVASACFYWDWKLGFDDTKYYSAAAVVVYMILNAVLAFWVKYVEGATVYEGTAPGSGHEKVSIATSTHKLDPVYHVTVTTTPAQGKPQTTTFSRPFAEWFDGAGHFVAPPFQTMFASEVAAIGRVDKKRAAPTPAPVAETPYDAETLAILAGADKASTATEEPADKAAVATGSSSSSQKKGGKRRKA